MSAAEITGLTRSAVSALVDCEERRTGSRMTAYDVVARTVGVSSSWIQKFISCQPMVKEPRMTVFQNIRVAYDNLCERVEQQNRADEMRLRQIKDDMDAVTEGFDPKSHDQVADRGGETEDHFRDIAG